MNWIGALHGRNVIMARVVSIQFFTITFVTPGGTYEKKIGASSRKAAHDHAAKLAQQRGWTVQTITRGVTAETLGFRGGRMVEE
jgi:hypothetical protein